MGKITLNVNNQRVMTLMQEKHDDAIILYVGQENGAEKDVWAIPQGDFVMLMNYYRYKKEKGENIF